jgi:hypothetical protein
MKLNSIRKLIICLITFILFYSCAKDSGIGQFDELVVESKENPYKFSQITFVVSINDPAYGYLNLPLVDSMKIYVNAKYWGTFSSETNDTTDRTDLMVNNIRYSKNKIKYLVIAPYQLKVDNLTYAGDFVDYLKKRIVLTPGDYVCEIKEIKFRTQTGDIVTKKTQAFAEFSVLQNTTSSYVGDIEMFVK